MTEIWLSTKEAADLVGYTPRQVRNKVEIGEYHGKLVPSPTGGRGRLQILLQSLPEPAQKAYQNKHGEYQIVFNTSFTGTKAQKDKGTLRRQAVREYKTFKKKAKKGGMNRIEEIMNVFIKQWNEEHTDLQIGTRKTLYEWVNRLKNGDNLDDKRGGYNKGQSAIPEYYKEFFNKRYLQQTKPSIQSCYDETKLEADKNGDCIPGIKAFRNHEKTILYALKVFAREGQKAFDDKCMPYIERDYSLLQPNQFWVSDHHLWDIFVRVPDNKGEWKLARPWGSYWMDMRTRKIMSSIIRIESPNSDVVLCSFGLGVKKFGIPNGVRLDNGKDYKARDLFYPEGHYIVSEDDKDKIFSSLASNLQIETTYAIPYNAKAKPIERVFNTFEEQLGKKYPSYAGSNAKQRPEDLKNLNIMDVITLEEFIEHHNKFVYEIYNNDEHSGDAMHGKSPNQVYAEIDFTKRKTTEEMLYFSLMRVKGQRTVQRNGITFKGVHFYNDNCINYIGQKVTAKYDPTKPEILYIFDQNENFLFVAEEIQKQGWNLTDEDYQRENERKKLARQVALNDYKPNNEIRSTEAIGERLQRQAESMEHVEDAKPKTIEIVRNDKIEETLKRISMSDIDREYEDVLKRDKARKQVVPDKQKKYADKFRKDMIAMAYEKQA